MNDFNSVTWSALGLTLTVLGLMASFVVWRRRGPGAGLRWSAFSLLPLAAGLTGTLRLFGEISSDVTRYLTRLVFSPTVWLGFAVLAVAVMLWLVSWIIERRSAASAPPLRREGRRQVARREPKAPKPTAQASSDGADFDEIEAILRKRGIS